MVPEHLDGAHQKMYEAGLSSSTVLKIRRILSRSPEVAVRRDKVGRCARWSVALALGIRQGEALELRWSHVDLATGITKAWFQIQRAEWRLGCDDPHACKTPDYPPNRD
jgi:integrase